MAVRSHSFLFARFLSSFREAFKRKDNAGGLSWHGDDMWEKLNFGNSGTGAYAEYIAVSTHMLIHKPAELSWEQAAGIPEVPLSSLSPIRLLFSPVSADPSPSRPFFRF